MVPTCMQDGKVQYFYLTASIPARPGVMEAGQYRSGLPDLSPRFTTDQSGFPCPIPWSSFLTFLFAMLLCCCLRFWYPWSSLAWTRWCYASRKHEKKHQRPIPCEVEGCEFRFADRRGLKRYKHGRHSDKFGTLKVYCCCGTSYTRSDNLKRRIDQ